MKSKKLLSLLLALAMMFSLAVTASAEETLVISPAPADEIVILHTNDVHCNYEAYDKVAKAYNLGYPGGIYIDKLAQSGDRTAFRFPYPKLKNPYRELDMSFSGLKSAVINQSEHFRYKERSKENLAASFQYTAINYVVSKVVKAIEITGIKRVSAGGGVAANSYLREKLSSLENDGVEVVLPSLKLCGDNGIMVAALGSEYLERGITDVNINAESRNKAYKGYMNKCRQNA